LQAAGASISLNPDDPDFMQARFGKKVYDITGGTVGYVRTALRIFKGAAKEIKNLNGKEANSYMTFAASSAWKTLVANKLSPNTAYAYHFFTHKSAERDENGHFKPFDPYEITKVYPLYVDGTKQAFKDGGLGSAMTVLLPDLFGIGTQQYEKSGNSGKATTKPAQPKKPKQPKMPKY
jgi:hypothetical protein